MHYTCCATSLYTRCALHPYCPMHTHTLLPTFPPMPPAPLPFAREQLFVLVKRRGLRAGERWFWDVALLTSLYCWLRVLAPASTRLPSASSHCLLPGHYLFTDRALPLPHTGCRRAHWDHGHSPFPHLPHPTAACLFSLLFIYLRALPSLALACALAFYTRTHTYTHAHRTRCTLRTTHAAARIRGANNAHCAHYRTLTT